jgi:hypothetical protein
MQVLEEKPQPAWPRQLTDGAYCLRQQPPQVKIILLKAAEGTKPSPSIKSNRHVSGQSQRQSDPQTDERNNDPETDYNDKQAQKQVEVGMAYLQRGIRWIPAIVEIDGKGCISLNCKAPSLMNLLILTISKRIWLSVCLILRLRMWLTLFHFRRPCALVLHFRPDSSTAYAFFQRDRASRFQHTIMIRAARSPAGPQINLGPELKRRKIRGPVCAYAGPCHSKKASAWLPIAEFTLSYEDVIPSIFLSGRLWKSGRT